MTGSFTVAITKNANYSSIYVYDENDNELRDFSYNATYDNLSARYFIGVDYDNTRVAYVVIRVKKSCKKIIISSSDSLSNTDSYLFNCDLS
jgi:hypothetical protein